MKPEDVKDRFHDLPTLFKERGFKVGAEIGVSTGFYSKWLFYGIPGLKLFLVDPWKPYEGYVEHHNPEDQTILDGCLAKAHERLDGKNAVFIRKTSMEAVKDFKDESLDFVFIDADKKNYSKYMELTYPMLRKGGVICGDNALGFGHIAEKDPKSEPGNVKAIQTFNQNMKNHAGLFSCLVTMGDGMCMGIKI